jgi:hypothetical protein
LTSGGQRHHDECSGRIRDHMADIMAVRDPDRPFSQFLPLVVSDWIAYFHDHPVDRGVTFASNFRLRSTVRGVTNRHYLEVLRPLLKRAADRGELRADADVDHLLALLVLLLPHLALAPFGPELDPVLGLYGLDQSALVDPVHALIGALERAFGPSQ